MNNTIQDIYEPLSRYRDEFQQKFRSLAQELFDSLKKTSGVDAAANEKTVREFHQLQDGIASLEKRKNFQKIIAILLGLLAAGCVIFALVQFFDPESRVGKENAYLLWSSGAILTAVLSLLLLFLKLIPGIRQLTQRVLHLQEEADEKEQKAWEQMAPLNVLYTWDMIPELLARTLPLLQIDPIFHEGRLRELQERFDFPAAFNENKSVVETLSGSIAGNPFAFVTLRRQEWGEETYTGYLEISWEETTQDSEGKTRTVVRTETLSASVTKPKPVFIDENQLLYGNDTAPDLFFSREPSDLSGGEEGLIHNWKKKRKLNSLKKFAQDLTDDSDFTMMSNEEFEVLFHAKNRTDEIQFRVLFTALAQQQMVALLNDKEIGYGDDFTFTKMKRMNIISPDHLQSISLSCDPAQFHSMDLAAAEKFFMERTESYFRHFYFAFAPLLVIPAYQDVRPWDSIYEPYKNISSFWEHEALANSWGDESFAHPLSQTCNILKAAPLATEEDSTRLVEIKACGFQTFTHVEYIPVWGRDGRCHDVPVEWEEYLPVEQTSQVAIFGGDSPRGKPSPEEYEKKKEEFIARTGSENLIFRRDLIGVILKK